MQLVMSAFVRWLMLGLAICLGLGEGLHALTGLNDGHVHFRGANGEVCQAGHRSTPDAASRAAGRGHDHRSAGECKATASRSACVFHRHGNLGPGHGHVHGRAPRDNATSSRVLLAADQHDSSTCSICQCLSLSVVLTSLATGQDIGTPVLGCHLPALPVVHLVERRKADPRGPPIA